ncbi:MAG: dienelactone hydrolase family protein, partial [Planctomycetota bacterium]
AAPTSEHDIRTEQVTYTAGGATCTGYLAYDAKVVGKRPGVLVVHEWWGHNAYVQRRARMLAELGYTALALDMYGDGKTASHPQDAAKFMNEVLANMAQGAERFEAGKRVLQDHETVDRERIAAIGYCFGGAVALGMARSGMDLDAVVSFHGSLATKTPAKKGAVKARVLVCNGAADSFVSKEEIAAFEAEMDAAGAKWRLESYPGAVHGFTSEEATENGKKFNLPLAYDAGADRKSWASMQALFADVWK